MKKTIILLIISFILVLSGCNSNYVVTDNSRIQISEEVLRCLDEEDTEGLKEMLCPKITQMYDIDEQIETAMNFYVGSNSSHGSITGGEGEGVDEGVKIYHRISPRIQDITTDSGNSYEIKFYMYIVCEENQEKVGISEITITNEYGEECVIGDYYLVNPENS